MKVRVFYHDKCFDGASSAALFSRFYSECVHADAGFVYTGLVHRAGSLFDETLFDGDENAIVDFKYSTSPKVTWWFDHHQSAFLTPQDESHFRRSAGNKKFFDPKFRSCTKFIATTAREKFGFNPDPVTELVKWADIIDGAQYEDAKTAVEMRQPAMKLAMVIEATQDATFLPRLIPLLAQLSFAEIIERPLVAPLITPLLERHKRSMEILKNRAEYKDGTIFFDICDQPLEGYNKFIPYFLYPQSTYSVGLSRSDFRTKISIGSNPWSQTPNMVNLANICERYGGGGHARVGAVSFGPDHVDDARAAAKEVVAELRSSLKG